MTDTKEIERLNGLKAALESELEFLDAEIIEAKIRMTEGNSDYTRASGQIVREYRNKLKEYRNIVRMNLEVF